MDGFLGRLDTTQFVNTLVIKLLFVIGMCVSVAIKGERFGTKNRND